MNLRGVKVTSGATEASDSTGSNCCNGRLGLVAAASQRQGKRPSQEDRTTVAADLAVALTEQVCAAYFVLR